MVHQCMSTKETIKADIDLTEELQLILKWAEVNEFYINKSKTRELYIYFFNFLFFSNF